MGGSHNGADLGDQKEEMWEGLGTKNMDKLVWTVLGYGVDLGMEGKRRNRKTRRKIYKNG